MNEAWMVTCYNEADDFFNYKVEDCYRRETDAVVRKYRENLKKYVDRGYYPDATHDISRREW